MGWFWLWYSKMLRDCPANSATFPPAYAELGRQWNNQIKINPTQVSDRMNNPVHIFIRKCLFVNSWPESCLWLVQSLLQEAEEREPEQHAVALRDLGERGPMMQGVWQSATDLRPWPRILCFVSTIPGWWKKLFSKIMMMMIWCKI